MHHRQYATESSAERPKDLISLLILRSGPSVAQPGTLAQQPVAAHFGICGEHLSPGQLIILASMEGVKCIYKVNYKYRFAWQALATNCPYRRAINLNSERKCQPCAMEPTQTVGENIVSEVSFQESSKMTITQSISLIQLCCCPVL